MLSDCTALSQYPLKRRKFLAVTAESILPIYLLIHEILETKYMNIFYKRCFLPKTANRANFMTEKELPSLRAVQVCFEQHRSRRFSRNAKWNSLFARDFFHKQVTRRIETIGQLIQLDFCPLCNFLYSCLYVLLFFLTAKNSHFRKISRYHKVSLYDLGLEKFPFGAMFF